MESTGNFTADLLALRARSYDRCQTCDRALPEGEPALAGYGASGEALYVGACCSGRVTELASHIYWWWKVDTRVSPEITLWRYMDLAKFLHLLESRSLFFPRADKFDDAFEGASGLAERQGEWDSHYLEYFRGAIRRPPEGYPSPPEESVEPEAQRLLIEMKAGIKRERESTYISCWHANPGESEALWRLYCPAGSAGVALQTTAGRLASALDASDIELGRVHYIDYRKGFSGLHDRIFWKRSSLSHEAEVRAVFKQRFLHEENNGAARLVDVETLCVSVVPSPFSPPWFSDLLQSLLERYELMIPLARSELLSRPFF
jgi:hypothetical protein